MSHSFKNNKILFNVLKINKNKNKIILFTTNPSFPHRQTSSPSSSSSPSSLPNPSPEVINVPF
jgi:hypothetical protein